MTERRLLPDARHAGQRLDTYLRQELTGYSRRELNELFSTGNVRVDGRRASKGETVHPGHPIEVTLPDVAASEPPTLRVVLERGDLVLVDKPPGLPTVPLGNEAAPTLASALLHDYPETGGVGYRDRESGLLSRLDTQTSGVVACARTREAFTELKHGASRGELTKQYQALVRSHPALRPSLLITTPLGPHLSDRRKVGWGSQIRGRGANATTRLVTVEQHSAGVTLLSLQVNTAYRHQLRAHLASIGCPLLGDTLYGGPPFEGLTRHALHSQRLAWRGTASCGAFDVTVDLPEDLARCL